MPQPRPATPPWLPRADRLVVVAASLLILCIIALGVGVIWLANLQERGTQEGARVREIRSAVYDLSLKASDAELDRLVYILDGDARFLREGAIASQAMHDSLAHAHALTTFEPSLRERLERIALLIDRMDQRSAEVIAARRAGRLSARQIHDAAVELESLSDAMRVEFSPLLGAIETRVDRVRDRNAQGRASLYWLAGILIVLALSAAGVALFAIRAERTAWRSTLAIMVRAHDEAENARAKAAASDMAKTRFLAAASHDMRQPLHALTLYLSALQRRIETDEAKGILAKAERATQSMVGMFNTLLDLARIQADVVKPEIEIIAVQEVIDRVLGEHPDADVKGPTPPTTIEAKSDPVLLERLLRNLVSNALRHGGGAARIAVEARRDRVLISVSDQGPGIPEEEQERIFEEFVRLDGRAGAEGLGLGLAIVKRLADLLGATLEVRSAVNEGATFIVGLPLAGTHAPAQTAAPAVEIMAANAPILVMDDDPLALEAEMGVLRDLGAEVRGCANEADLQAALDAGFRPRLLVMDLRIDGELVGVDIATRARARLTPPPRVLMVTGDTAPETLARLRASGYGWLIKPVSRADFADAVTSARGSSVT